MQKCRITIESYAQHVFNKCISAQYACQQCRGQKYKVTFIGIDDPQTHFSFLSHHLQFYDSGVYDQPTCSSTKLNHAILIVGYATDGHGKDYWIVKNR